MGTEIIVRRDGGEKVTYNYEGHPVRAGRFSFSEFADSAVAGHWHEELEFVLLESGSMLLEMEGASLRLETGQGAFINSRCSHRVLAEGREDDHFLLLQAHPVLLCASRRMEERFVLPYLTGEEFPYVPLRGSAPWERRILEDIKEACGLLEAEEGILESQALLLRMWLALYQNLFSTGEVLPHNTVKGRRLTSLKAMVDFIQQNYPQKIRLEDIAQAGGMQKTACSDLFHRYLGEPPIAYMTRYRLQEGARLLRTTNSTVTDITYAVGFSSASYFVRAFRERYGCTPLQYRAAGAQ